MSGFGVREIVDIVDTGREEHGQRTLLPVGENMRLAFAVGSGFCQPDGGPFCASVPFSSIPSVVSARKKIFRCEQKAGSDVDD